MHEFRTIEKGIPLEEAEKGIILLHGRGGSAADIMRLANEFYDERFYMVAPQATNNSWYPYSFLAPEEQNEPWLTSAVHYVKEIIDETAIYLGTENIFIMGFSQGACLALETAARFATKYSGVAAFTGGLIGEKLRTEKYKGDFKETKIFIGNSDHDPHVPVTRSEDSGKILESLGAEVTLKVYRNMPHTIIPEEIETVKKMMFDRSD